MKLKIWEKGQQGALAGRSLRLNEMMGEDESSVSKKVGTIRELGGGTKLFHDGGGGTWEV